MIKVQDRVCEKLYSDIKGIALSSYMREVNNQSILITGGNGFLAYYITLSLLCLNDELNAGNIITILVRKRKRAENRYGDLLNRKDILVLEQDICTPFSDDCAYDYIIHAASSADAKHFDENPIGVFDSNVMGTQNVLELIKKSSCKSMVYISSFTVYGAGTELQDSVEETYFGADNWNTNRSCYSLGKRCAEFICTTAVRKYNYPIKIVRPGFIYGANSAEDMRVYSEIVKCAAFSKPIKLQSAGLIYRSMVYVTDVVRGILFVLFCGQDGEAYNIANEYVSIREFAETAVKVATDENVFIDYANPSDKNIVEKKPKCGAMSIKKISEYGWQPEVSLENGIAMSMSIQKEMEK